MVDKYSILIVGCLFFSLSLCAQCIGSDSLWRKLKAISYSQSLSSKEKLQILFAEKARIENCPGREDSSHAYLLRRIGELYFLQGDFLSAAQYYQQSIDLMTRNAGKPSINSKHLIKSYYWLSAFYDSLNMTAEKLSALDNCVNESMAQHAVDSFSLSALYKQVEFFFDVGDYHRCLFYAGLCERLGTEYSNQKNKRVHDLGLSYAASSLGWHTNALLILKEYDSAAKLLKTLLHNENNSGQTKDRGGVYARLAEVEEHQGNFDKALADLNRGFVEEKKEGDDINCKTILNNIGYYIFFLHYNMPDKALEYYRRALRYTTHNNSENLLNSIESLNVFEDIATAYVRKKSFDSAFLYFGKAFDQIKPGIEESGILHSSLDVLAAQKKIGYLTGMMIDKGDAFCEKYKVTKNTDNIRQAIRTYKITDQLIDRIKTEQSDVESKLFWRSDSRRLYEHAIEASYMSGNIEDAFYFFEKSRAVLLSDQLNEQRWVDESDIRRQAQLNKKMLALQREINLPDLDPSRYKELQAKFFAKDQELKQLLQVIKIQNPLYYQNFLNPGTITLDDLRNKVLGKDQALLEIFSGDSAVYRLIVTPGKTDLIAIKKDLFDSLSKSYIQFISNPLLLNKNFDDFIYASHQLYQLLFQNVDFLVKRLIISPDGKYFPFESLVTGNVSGKLDYLINNCATSYTYSARYLLQESTPLSESGIHDFLGLAPVKFSANMRLATLNGSDHSLQLLNAHFKDGNELLFGKATKSEFLRRFSDYKIIQLYTHASDSSARAEPLIYFEDSILFLSDLIREHRPATQLIVLSACQTGSGTEYKGEGIFSFNRGFAAMGIPTSISNLWNVDNESIYGLTELFYKYMTEGEPLDIALQHAKIEFMSSGGLQQLPYYWAPSILIGKNAAIPVERPLPAWAKTILFMMFFSGAILLCRDIYLKKNVAPGRKAFTQPIVE
jgi:CHAT domain-containing protein